MAKCASSVHRHAMYYYQAFFFAVCSSDAQKRVPRFVIVFQHTVENQKKFVLNKGDIHTIQLTQPNPNLVAVHLRTRTHLVTLTHLGGGC